MKKLSIETKKQIIHEENDNYEILDEQYLGTEHFVSLKKLFFKQVDDDQIYCFNFDISSEGELFIDDKKVFKGVAEEVTKIQYRMVE